METFRIGEIAKQADLPASTIRYYEQIGLLPVVQRVNGKRLYDATVLPKLGLIRMARQGGLSIAEIQSLIHEFPENTSASDRWQALASNKIPQIDAQIQHLKSMKKLLEATLDCSCDSLDDCGKSQFMSYSPLK